VTFVLPFGGLIVSTPAATPTQLDEGQYVREVMDLGRYAGQTADLGQYANVVDISKYP
jgi:hypothetical protein